MNKQETIKLLALIKLAYPEAYKDMDDATKKGTVNMWALSFPDVPYPLMEQAFNHHRMTSTFSPKVAEIASILRHIYFHAAECALIQKTLGNEEGVRHFKAIMSCTYRYKDNSNLGLQLGSMPSLLTGGESNVQRLGASGDHPRIEDRLPIVDDRG